MSYRRPSVRRNLSTSSPRRPSSANSEGEVVENPNSYGIFGRYEHAPQAVRVFDHNTDDLGVLGHAHEHRENNVHDHHPGWNTIEVHRNQDPASHHHQHNFHMPTAFQRSNNSSQHSHQSPHGDAIQTSSFHSSSNTIIQQQAYNDNEAESMYQRASHDFGATGRVNEAAETPLVENAVKPGMSPTPSRISHGEDVQDNAFVHVHGGNEEHIAQHGEQIPVRMGHLFKRPVIRQWVLQDKVYREVDDREPSQFELFFDLVMVGVIHALAEAAAEAATGLNVAKFVLCFYPAWSVWSDVRSYINVSGTDDVWQRIYILVIMILLMGYTSNASGIVIEKVIGTEEAAGHIAQLNGGHENLGTTSGTGITWSGEHGSAAGAETHKRALMAVAGSIGTYLVKRSEGHGEDEGPEAVLVRQIGHTGYWFASGWHEAIASAIGFYMVAKFLRFLLYVSYGCLLPKFRKALFLNAASIAVISCIYLPIIFIYRPGLIVILLAAGVAAEVVSRYAVAAVLQIVHGRAKHRGHKTYMPAYSLPHMMERTTLFTILVIGEIIMNSMYTAFKSEYGPQAMFWRGALAIVIAFLLMWLYFDVDSSRTFVHGLKRHWFTSITYNNLHFPLSAGLILMGSAMTKMIHKEDVEKAYYWFFAGSIGLAMLCMGVLGMLHKSLDLWGSSALPRFTRISLRFILGGVFIAMPAVRKWTSVEFLGVYAALLAFAVVFETFGKLGSVGRTYDPVRAEALRRQRLGTENKTPSAYGDIPMSNIKEASGEKKAVHRLTMTQSIGNAYDLSRRKFNKDAMVKSPGRRASWHEYDDLTGAERGEEDVGIESEIGKLEAKHVSTGERWAYVAT